MFMKKNQTFAKKNTKLYKNRIAKATVTNNLQQNRKQPATLRVTRADTSPI